MTTDNEATATERNESPEFVFARNLVLQAGANALDRLNAGYVTEWKSDNTPVTTMDTDNDVLISTRIRTAYPDDSINSEERDFVKGTSGYTWVEDPIDGSQALGLLDTWTICLARTDPDGQSQFSHVYNPTRKELFSGRRGESTTLNDEPVKVSAKGEIKGSYVFFGSQLLKAESLTTNGFAYDRLEIQGAKILNVRSLAFGCCMVVAGKVEGAFIGVKTPFEAASVALLVEGAGGKVTDLFGNPASRLDGEINGLVVSNGLIHDVLLEAIAV